MNHEKNAAYTQIQTTVEALRKFAVAHAAQSDPHHLRLANLLTAEEFRLRSALAQLAAFDAVQHNVTGRMSTKPRPAMAPRSTPVPAGLSGPAAPPAPVPPAPAPTARPTTEADCLLTMARAIQEAVAALDRVDQAWEDLIAHRGVAKPEDEDPAYVAYPSTFPNFQTVRLVLSEWGDRLRREAAPEPEKA